MARDRGDNMTLRKEKYKLNDKQQKVCLGLWKNFLDHLKKMKEGQKIGVADLDNKYWLELKSKEEL